MVAIVLSLYLILSPTSLAHFLQAARSQNRSYDSINTTILNTQYNKRTLVDSQVVSVNVDDVIQQRLERLDRIGKAFDRPHCTNSPFIFVEENPYGRSGNNMVELVHGLW